MDTYGIELTPNGWAVMNKLREELGQGKARVLCDGPDTQLGGYFAARWKAQGYAASLNRGEMPIESYAATD